MLVKNLDNTKILAFSDKAPADISFIWYNLNNGKKYFYNLNTNLWEEVLLSQKGVFLPFLTTKQKVSNGNAIFFPFDNEGEVKDQKVALLSVEGGSSSIPGFLQEEYFIISILEDGRYVIKNKYATEDQEGLVKKATDEEVLIGKENTKYITPFQLFEFYKPAKIEFSNTSTPLIENYEELYLELYSNYPSVQLLTYSGDDQEWEHKQTEPTWHRVDGILQSITFDLPDLYSGYILLKR